MHASPHLLPNHQLNKHERPRVLLVAVVTQTGAKVTVAVSIIMLLLKVRESCVWRMWVRVSGHRRSVLCVVLFRSYHQPWNEGNRSRNTGEVSNTGEVKLTCTCGCHRTVRYLYTQLHAHAHVCHVSSATFHTDTNEVIYLHARARTHVHTTIFVLLQTCLLLDIQELLM